MMSAMECYQLFRGNQLCVNSFNDGIKDIELQQTLRLKRHRTLKDALFYTLEYEAAKNASRQFREVYQGNHRTRQ